MRDCRSLFLVLCTAVIAGSVCLADDEVQFKGGKPAMAQAGECWCLFTIPAQYKTVSEQVMVCPPSCRYETIPAVFETRTEKVCVKPESKRRIEIPAEYRTENYQVCVKKEQKHKEKIPAVYEDRQEKVCVKKEHTVKHKIPAVFRSEEYQVCVEPARTEWRKTDCAANVSADNMKEVAGECWCLFTVPARYETRTRQVCVEKEKCVEEVIPAEYKTVCKKVCVQKESCREIKVPAVFETRTRQVVCKPASCRYEVIPAEFKTVEKQVCVKPACKRKIEIPATYETRTKEVCVAPSRQVWRKVDCGTAGATSLPAPMPVATTSCDKPCETKCHKCEVNTCCEEPQMIVYENEPNFYTDVPCYVREESEGISCSCKQGWEY